VSFGYTTINGQRVEAHVAAAFEQMNKAFYLAFGLWLIITSGTRTRAEQEYLYNGWINRLPGFNLAAKPGFSNHEEDGPSGPRSIDIADTGTDYGVTRRGTVRDLWMQNNAHRWEFENEGYKFNPVEAWHKTWRGVLEGTASGGSTPINQDVQNRQNWLNKTQGEQLETDGILGPKTIAAIQRYQVVLRDGGFGYTGAIDGDWGANTQSAHEKYAAKWAADHAPTSPAYPNFPLPAGYYFGPKDGPEESVSGYYSYRAELKAWQTRMAERGWSITPDGLYGDETKNVTIAFQKEKGLTVDGKIGPETWKAAWTLPVTPAGGGSTPPTTTTPPPVVVTPPPISGYIPTQVENPRGLPVVPATYPGAKYALQAPLGDGKRGTKGTPPVPVETVVDRAIEHWTGVDTLQYDWFSYKNSRSSCPNWYITLEGDVVEFIPFEMKPALTGSEWNWRSVGWEIQKRPDGTGSSEQFEAICQLLAWLASLDGKTYRNTPERFKLTREYFKNHQEALPGTECPGPWWAARMDAQLERAKEIYAEKYANQPQPEPEPEPEPEPQPEMVTVEKAWLENLMQNQYADGDAIKAVLT
jgi:peptidoglycan hydrolase-like protein with peptidoglycan-binding domain